MKPDEFEKLAALTRMKPRALSLARRVLVDAKGYTCIVNEERDAGRACSSTCVQRAAQRIIRELIKLEGVPSDWICVTVLVPSSSAKEIIKIKKTAYRNARILLS